MNPKGWKKTGRLRGHESRIGKFAWSPNGKSLATPSDDGNVVIWNSANSKPTVERSIGLPVISAAWSPDGQSLAVAVKDKSPIDHGYEYSEAEFEVYEGRGAEDELLRTFDASVAPPGAEGNWDRTEGAMHVRILDSSSGLQVAALDSGAFVHAPTNLVWLGDGEHIVVACLDGVGLWEVNSGHFISKFQDSAGIDPEVLLRVDDDKIIAAGLESHLSYMWDTRSGAQINSFLMDDVALSGSVDPVTGCFAIGTQTGLVQVLKPDLRETRTRALEGHAGGVTGVSFSPDGKLLASAARDGVKLWRTEDWTLLSELSGEVPDGEPGLVSFSPVDSTLAVLGPKGNEVSLWELDLPTLAAKQNRPATVHYSNAKIVLVGDTGVGKSGLGLVLAGKRFEPTDSTHQRNIWTLSTVDTGGDKPEHREVFLWDLAGQPGYRLLHQLHLSDVSVALIVFDARDELDPLSGVRYWSRALDQAGRVSDTDHQMARILVAARMDRGGAKVSDEELREVRDKFHLQSYMTTSAKEGAGVEALRRRIVNSIDWDSIQKVSSTGLFESIRHFLVAKRSTDAVLTSESDLRDAFSRTGAAPEKDILNEFRVCVDRLQSRGMLRRLSFGDLVLLKPEVLDAYAAAVVHGAASDEDGLGAIREADVRSANFLIPADDRLSDPAAEKLLLIATVEDLLKHEVALREDSGDGSYLVFPTQSSREIASDKSMEPWCSVAFEGPLAHIWATLVVRLSHSGVFVRDEVGLNFAVFRGAGYTVGLRLRPIDEGTGELELLKKEGSVKSPTEQLFEGFVIAHLERRAISDSLEVRYVATCPACGFVVPGSLVEEFQERKSLRCPSCAAEVNLEGRRTEGESQPSAKEIIQLQRTADRERSRVAARTSVEGKVEIHEFDAFLAHNSRDHEAAVAIAERLRNHGLNPWLDREQIPPGRWFQDIIQEAIGKVRSAVIFLGKDGLGRWEELELRAFMAECVERNVPVIPVLLPGGKMPASVRPFLSQLQLVEFAKDINEDKPFSDLVWGITGDRKERDRVLRGESGAT